jgi:peptidoglycan/LPS O-acetylase OafA/YrhL
MNHTIDGRYHGLDTLRASAIALVFLFHCTSRMPASVYPIARFGWMGVDLFFVLSGYLIGTQLLRPYAMGSRPLWRDFYRRRMYRVMPAYLAVLAVYVVVPGWREATNLPPAWQMLTFTQNLFVDYGRNQAFSHVWSLCVEEHFYLILPLLVGALMLRPSLAKGAAAVGALVLLGIMIRAAIRHYVMGKLIPGSDEYGLAYIERIYYPTWARLDGLIAGVAMAAVRLFRPAWWEAAMRRGHVLTALGAVFVGTCVWLFSDRFGSNSGAAAWGTVVGFPLLASGLGLLVASALSRDGVLARIKVPGARMVALLSYSIYLTHKEVMHLVEVLIPAIADDHPWSLLAVGSVAALAVGGVLYAMVERPFLRLRDRHDSRVRLEREMLREPAI